LPGKAAARHGKREQPAVQAFEYELEPQLWAIHRELEAGDYQWGAYRQFRIYDPKHRVIRAAPFRDRVVHHGYDDAGRLKVSGEAFPVH
jgi:RNA-directed DNA polymerase